MISNKFPDTPSSTQGSSKTYPLVALSVEFTACPLVLLNLCPDSSSLGFLQLDHGLVLPTLRYCPRSLDGIRYPPRHHTVSPRVSFAVVFGCSSTQKAWIRQRRPYLCSGHAYSHHFLRAKASLCSGLCAPPVLPLLLTPCPVSTPAAQSTMSSQEPFCVLLPLTGYSLSIDASPRCHHNVLPLHLQASPAP